MARAYKCDICNRLFEKRISLDIGKLFISVVDENCPSVKKDICPECVAAIQEAIDERSALNESK